MSLTRPFYADHAAAYDLLVTDPVEPWVDAVHERIQSQGWAAARVLDAGCGTGRHAAALAALGHHVDLADASAELLSQAMLRNPAAQGWQVDLCALDIATQYQAVTCRGVLNDMITDAERDAVLHSLAGALVPGGLLLLDVREAEASRARTDGATVRRTVDLGDHTELDFSSTPTWRSALLHIREEYTLRAPAAPADHRVYEFTMRPWTGQELRDRLTTAGFRNIEVAPGVGRKTPDRYFVIAERATH